MARVPEQLRPAVSGNSVKNNSNNARFFSQLPNPSVRPGGAAIRPVCLPTASARKAPECRATRQPLRTVVETQYEVSYLKTGFLL